MSDGERTKEELLQEVGSLRDEVRSLLGERSGSKDIPHGFFASDAAEFLRELVDHICKTMDVDWAIVGILDDENDGLIHTVAVCSHGKIIENFNYGLEGTPCDNVSGKSLCIYESGIQELFPEDISLVDMGVVSYAGAPLRDLEGNPLGILAVLDNKPIEDADSVRELLVRYVERASMELRRLKTEEALLASEERFRRLVESAADSFFVHDTGGNIINVNRNACESLGYSREDLIGMNISEIRARYEPQESENLWKRTTDGEVQTVEGWQKRKDGSEFPVEVRLCLFELEGKRQVLALVRDVTERKRLEAEQKALAERLKRAERMESLGLLAGGVAHDLNNIIGPILGYPDLILSDMSDDNPIRGDIERIKNAAIRASDVIGDLLTLARRGKYDMKPLNLNELVAAEIKTHLHDELKKLNGGIDLIVDLAYDLLNIKGSDAHIPQVLLNLFINAMESMENGGTLTIRTSNRYVDKRKLLYEEITEGDYVVLEIIDEGCGIEAENFSLIFDPFFTTKKRDGSGIGIGLSVVYGIVKDHDGIIDVESTPGEGSKFTLYFPVTREETVLKGKASVDYSGDETILIVDDISIQRELASRLLSSLGYKTHTVESGQAAVEYLKKEKVDLVMLDMIMQPGFDGLDTYEEILKIHPSQKAIIASGYSETSRVKKAIKLGVGSFVRKPYTIEKVGIALRLELDKIKA